MALVPFGNEQARAVAPNTWTGMRSAPGGTPTARRPKKRCAPSARCN